MPLGILFRRIRSLALSDLVMTVLAQVKRAQKKAEFERDRINFNFIDTRIRAVVVVGGGRSRRAEAFCLEGISACTND